MRYTDILVHRLLNMAITLRGASWDQIQVHQATEHCYKIFMAKRVKILCFMDFSFCMWTTASTRAFFQLMDHSLDVLILNMGVVNMLYMDRLGVHFV